ncbi:MAG TPA: DUF4157 domain-containing protein [Chloroflexota bacterium]|nr:DUF4157 domain-containing protein [Chloroflexota bacterium]
MATERLRIRRARRAEAVPLEATVDAAFDEVAASGLPTPGAGHHFGDYALLPGLPGAGPGATYEVSRPGDSDELAAERLVDRALSAEAGPAPAVETAERITGSTAGAPLPGPVRRSFESGFGQPLDGVRLHSGSSAAGAAAALQARAFTVGSDIVFGAGELAPETPSGQRLLAHELAHVVQAGDRPHNGGQRVFRWHDDGHMACARDAAEIVFVGPSAGPFFSAIGMDKETFIARLEDASCNMDRVAGHIKDRYLSTLPAFGLSLVTSGIRNLFQEATGIQTEESKTRRGIVGEGLNHGEAGNYQEPKESAAPRNEAHSLKFASEAAAAFASGDYDLMINKLGDAVHVSADRGSHEEGGIGRGHDIRMPREDLGESGTDINAGYMENWDDNDSLALNPGARAVGTTYTVEVLVAFFSEALPLLAQNGADTVHAEGQSAPA